MERNRVIEIDALRGFAIFLVILGHSIIVFPIDLHEVAWCKFLYDLIYSFHMPLFFLISGYCFSIKDSYKKFVKKKFTRLIVPYVFFSIIDIMSREFLSSFVNRKGDLVENIEKMFFKGGEYWFLYTLFIISIIFPLIDKIINKKEGYKWACLLIAFVLSIESDRFTDVFRLDSVSFYLFFFLLGYLIKRHSVESTKMEIKSCFVIIPVMVWIILVVVGYKVCSTVMIIAALLGSLSAGFLCRNQIIQKFFCRFSKYSLALYMMNGYWLVVSRTVVCKLLNISNPLVIIVFNVLVDMFVSYFIIKKIYTKYRVIRCIFGDN